jgi:predicted methyltransferase
MDNVIKFSHHLLKEHLTKDDIAIDMTVGNGNDTLVLVQTAKFVYGFDIQKQACINAKNLLQGYTNYKIINDSHLSFDQYVQEEIAGVIFNLGYLPGGNKNIHTNASTVLKTLKKVLKLLKTGGICILVFYPGHPSGMEEVKIIGTYLSTLNQKEYDVLKYEFINQINNPPFLIAIKKRI